MPSAEHPLCLLVEGQSDLFAIAHLIEERFKRQLVSVDADKDGSDKVYIDPRNGAEGLLKKGVISRAVKSCRRLGIVIDANGSPTDRWRAVADRLNAENVVLPPAPAPDGTIVAGIRDGWKVGVWLMPNNVKPGAIEDFLVPLVPPGDILWPLAKASTAMAETADRRYGPTDGLKALLGCWLAWQENPEAGVGPALSTGVLNPLHVSADPFVRWWDELFS